MVGLPMLLVAGAAYAQFFTPATPAVLQLRPGAELPPVAPAAARSISLRPVGRAAASARPQDGRSGRAWQLPSAALAGALAGLGLHAVSRGAVSTRDRAPSRRASSRGARTRVPVAGLFDGLFGETPEQKAAKDREWQAMQEMQKRRQNPEAMKQYYKEVEEKRAEASAEGAELKAAQKAGDLEAWKKLRAEGKVTVSDQERDADSARLGSDGLIAERIDEKLPFIDSGYVDESQPDFMEEVKKLFGGNKKK